MLSVALKKRLDTLAKSSVPKVKGANIPKASTSVPSHASRLIVRNIPFNATEQDLRAVFLPYGPIYSIHIPNDDRPAKPRVEGEPEHEQPHPTSRRTKGFAFVWMLSKKDAERAMEGCNGMTLRSGMADELVRDKQKRKKVRRLEKKQAEAEKQKKAKEGGKDEGSDEEEASGDDEEMDVDDDAKRMERVIAVDWALSKDKWEKEKAKLEEDDADAKMSGSSADEDSESEDSGSGGSSDEVEDSASDDDDSDDLEEDDDDDGDRGQPTRPSLPAPEEGTTLFVRNIPFEATDDDLRTLCVFFLVLLGTVLIENFKIPSIWSSPVCTHCDGSYHRSLQRYRLCVLLERCRRRPCCSPKRALASGNVWGFNKCSMSLIPFWKII